MASPIAWYSHATDTDLHWCACVVASPCTSNSRLIYLTAGITCTALQVSHFVDVGLGFLQTQQGRARAPDGLHRTNLCVLWPIARPNELLNEPRAVMTWLLVSQGIPAAHVDASPVPHSDSIPSLSSSLSVEPCTGWNIQHQELQYLLAYTEHYMQMGHVARKDRAHCLATTRALRLTGCHSR